MKLSRDSSSLDEGLPAHFEGLLALKFQTTPSQYAQFISRFGKLHYWTTNEVWVVTDYKLAQFILKNQNFTADRGGFFISRMPDMDLSLIKDFFSVVQKMMVMSDGQEHSVRRKVAALGLTDVLIENFRPKINAICDKLLARLRETGQSEFVQEIAFQLPSQVLAELFDIPDADRSEFYRCSNEMTQFFGGASAYQNEDGRRVNQCAIYLKDYFSQLISRHRKELFLTDRLTCNDSFLGNMIKNQMSLGINRSINDDELISQCIMMMVAGSVTTTDQLCNNLFTLLHEPGALATLRENIRLLPTAIEEFNRLDPGVSYLFRVSKCDQVIEGKSIKAGETVFISNHAVNRDPAIFDRPFECILDREHNPHFAYGHGAHYCLGAKFARAQMTCLFGKLITEFPDLRLSETELPKRRHYSLAFSGFERFMIEA